MTISWEFFRDVGIAFIIGLILGFLLKKAFKVAIVVVIGFVLFHLFAHGGLQAENLSHVSQIGKQAGDFLIENRSKLLIVKEYLQINASMIIGFFFGMLTGFVKG